MADAGSRRHHPQVVELALRPTQQRVALAVALHLQLHVSPAGVGDAGVVHLNRVVDHQVDRHAGVDDRRVAPAPGDGRAQRRQVDHAGHAGEVLEQDPAGHEGKFGALGRGGVPIEEGQHVRVLHHAEAAVAESVLEEHADGVRKPPEIAAGRSRQHPQVGHPAPSARQVEGRPGAEGARTFATASLRSTGCRCTLRTLVGGFTHRVRPFSLVLASR